MNLNMLITGIVLCILTIVATVVCIIRTPGNLRGYYGIMFGICSIIGFVGGVILITAAF